ncbi:MAG TPA: hypothetical protein VII94_06180, partial [Candidatus Saccharimonadales bacterium]
FPKAMLEAGEIVPPRLHLIDGAEDQTTNATNTPMIVKNTIEAYVFHRKMIKKVSAKPDKIGAQLLIGCDGIKEMIRIYNDKAFKDFSKDMKTFAISSEGSFVNWEKCGSKDDFFTKLNALSDTEDAIILNVDMLTEGIDLPSITGVMPFRNLGLTKLIQLVGRALRLHKTDRAKLYSGEIKPEEYEKYIKPRGYLVVPRDLASINHHDKMIKDADDFYSEYGTKAEELVIQEKFIDHQPDRLDSMIPFNFGGGKDYDLKHTESDLIGKINKHQLKNDLAGLSDSEKEKYIRNIFQ